MTLSEILTLIGIGVTVILFVIAAVQRHASSDRKFQADAGRDHAKLAETVRNLESRFENLHDWKNHILPEQFKTHGANFENQVDRIAGDMGRRIERIERVLNGRLKE